MTSQEPVGNLLTARLVQTLFEQLQGSWTLNRQLQNANEPEQPGKCIGRAVLLPREPSLFVDVKGMLQVAAQELVYHEEGYLEALCMSSPGHNAQTPFSRKYIWRLQTNSVDGSVDLSIWFTKSGTEIIDCLFHKLYMISNEFEGDKPSRDFQLEGNGAYLCEEDVYSSSYMFDFGVQVGTAGSMSSEFSLKKWSMIHEARGPKKEECIQTNFTKL